jgi:histone acetyltransferase (RNA polymerase elongator complex component)
MSKKDMIYWLKKFNKNIGLVPDIKKFDFLTYLLHYLETSDRTKLDETPDCIFRQITRNIIRDVNLKVLTDKTALIRELHVYGTVKKIGEKGDRSQHVGFGIRLMKEAEKIAKENNYKKISVIAGIGVREYYKNKYCKLAKNNKIWNYE